jgi:hypothetical protein
MTRLSSAPAVLACALLLALLKLDSIPPVSQSSSLHEAIQLQHKVESTLRLESAFTATIRRNCLQNTAGKLTDLLRTACMRMTGDGTCTIP